MPKKLKPAIYERAAAYLLTGADDCCCRAIMHAVVGHQGYKMLRDDEPHIHALLNIFAPVSRPSGRAAELIYQPAYYWGSCASKECREQRVIALLLLAEMVRAEGSNRLPTHFTDLAPRGH